MLIRHLLFASLLISTKLIASTPTYIDLSHEYSQETLSWPSAEPFHITHTDVINNQFYVTARDFASSEHSGTHMDAPNHFAKGHKGISEISIENLIGPAVNIDVRNAVKTNPDHEVSIQDIQAWEKVHGVIPKHSIVLINTGYGQFWPNWELYAGTKKRGAASLTDLHFPGIAPKAALWLVENRKIKAIGIDTFSIDYGQTKRYEAHQVLTQHDVPIFENVANLDKLPADHFVIYAFPMKIKNGTGAPLRIVAQLSE